MELNAQIEKLKDQMIESIQEIIKIKSVEDNAKPGMPFGEGVANALEYALKLSEDMGFKINNLDGYVGYAEYGEGEDYIAVLGHLDVVPEESGWLHPAYGAEIHDGKIYGRGAVDDKGPTIAALYALKAIKDLDLKLSKKIRLIFGTNEETGCYDMEYYLKKEKAPVFGFTPDGDYPVIHGEKGLIKLNIIKTMTSDADASTNKLLCLKAGQRLNIVPDHCKAVINTKTPDELLEVCKRFIDKNGVNLEASRDGEDITVETFGKAAHGSLPELGENAIMYMLALLEDIDLGNKDLKDFLTFFNKNIHLDTTGKGLGIALKDEDSGSLSLNVGKIVLENNKIVVGCDIRFPVTYKLDDVILPLKQHLSASGLELEVLDTNEPLYFPKDHPLITKLQSVFVKHTNIELPPKTIGGGTYAKHLPNTVAYGTIMPGKPHLEHQANEYIELEDLILNAKIYAHAIYELAK